MRKIIAASALVMAGIGAAALAPQAYATPTSWIDNESAFICNALSLDSHEGNHDWATIAISTLQSKYSMSRAEAVAGIHQAAQLYCPSYASAAPVR